MIAKQRVGYAAYLAKLRALSAEDHLVREDEKEEEPSPPGVAEAVLLAMEAASLADRLGVSIAVMELVAMLSPAVVHRDLLRSAGQEARCSAAVAGSPRPWWIRRWNG
jgi:hypothetical protein